MITASTRSCRLVIDLSGLTFKINWARMTRNVFKNIDARLTCLMRIDIGL